MKEKVINVLHEVSEAVEKAILDGNFERVNVDSYTITIIVDGLKCEIWNSNSAESTMLYRTELGDECYISIGLPRTTSFKQPEKCREILRNNESKAEILQRIEELRKQKEDAERELAKMAGGENGTV